MVKVRDSSGGGVKEVSGVRIIERRHRVFDLLLHAPVFLLVIERPVFEDDILGLGNIDQKHLRRHFSFVVKR